MFYYEDLEQSHDSYLAHGDLPELMKIKVSDISLNTYYMGRPALEGPPHVACRVQHQLP